MTVVETKDIEADKDGITSSGERLPLLAGTREAASNNVNKVHHSVLHDVVDTINLGVPILFTRLSWVGMKTTDSALLGHVSAEALSAAALSDLWSMCTGVLIQGRVLGILVGQAVGAGNPKLAGVYLQVSFVVLGLLSVAVFISWTFTKEIWMFFGQAEDISSDAGYYARVLAFSIPGLVIFSQLSQYFSAQRIMHPEVIASLIALSLNLALGLFFVLGIPIKNWSGYGFTACPIVTTIVVYVQIFILWFVFIYLKKLHAPSWDGWSWEAISKERIMTFSQLYVPAALGSASDYWRVGVIGVVAARLGEVEVGIFNTSYRVMWITLVFVGSLATASGIKVSLCLGNGDAIGARQAGNVGICLAFFFLVIIAIIVLTRMRLIGLIFTQDEEFLDLLESSRLPFTATLFLMCLAVAIERIPYAMGRTAEVFWMGFIASWVAQVPAVVLLTTYWRDDLFALYTGMAIGYFVLVILYSAIVLTSDWKKYADLAQQRSEVT